MDIENVILKYIYVLFEFKHTELFYFSPHFKCPELQTNTSSRRFIPSVTRCWEEKTTRINQVSGVGFSRYVCLGTSQEV